MKQPRADLPAAGQEHAIRLLRGGLHGRFAQSFCVLQTTLDAMESVLRTQGNPALQDTMRPLLEEMARRLPALERLAGQAADLALGSTLRELHEPEPLELTSLVRVFCDCANEELARQGSEAVVVPEQEEAAAPLGLMGNESLIDALLANLLSNALREKRNVRITLRLTADRRLVCRDDGPGLPEDAWMLLLGGAWQEELLYRGGTGLLLVREYAACLGWQIKRQDGALTFVLPPAPQDLTLRSSEAKELLYAAQCRACIARELNALAVEEPRAY